MYAKCDKTWDLYIFKNERSRNQLDKYFATIQKIQTGSTQRFKKKN